MNQQASEKSQISLLAPLCLLICGTTLMKAGILLPRREDPENSSSDHPGASSASEEPALLHSFALFARHLGRPTPGAPRWDFCLFPAEQLGQMRGSHCATGAWSSGGSTPKETASEGLWDTWWEKGLWPRALSPPVTHSGALKRVCRQGTLQGALCLNNSMRSCEHRHSRNVSPASGGVLQRKWVSPFVNAEEQWEWLCWEPDCKAVCMENNVQKYMWERITIALLAAHSVLPGRAHTSLLLFPSLVYWPVELPVLYNISQCYCSIWWKASLVRNL